MKRKTIFSLIAIVAFAFSSCEEDSWEKGRLDYSFERKTDRNGYFESGNLLAVGDVKLTSYAKYINSLELDRSVVKISGNLKLGDVIDIEIEVKNVGVFRVSPIRIPSELRENTLTILDSDVDRGFNDFMYDAFNAMSRDGKQDIIVSGFLIDRDGRIVSNAYIYIVFYNDLNVNVRD